jgi:transketolase
MEYSDQTRGAGSNLSIPSQGNDMKTSQEIDQLAINTLRFLAIDAIQKANSGHPGAPMGAASFAYVLWDRFLKHNPRNPHWLNRDRFILSAGHASMLLYGLLYMTGYDISMEDIKAFRQWQSKTPGHPEYGLTPGVEVTSGPLGQGFANGVGMAIAERFLARNFNRPGFDIVDHYTYALVSDGDLQEGISYEAASLAGHLKLGKMIYLYDDNKIQIEGKTELVFSDDVKKRFEALNWHVAGPVDGNDLNAVENAIRQGQAETEKPSLIVCRTHIAYGSPGKQDSEASHGAPLGKDEVIATKKNLGWPLEPEFHVPEQAREYMSRAIAHGEKAEDDWNKMAREYKSKFQAEFEKLQRYIADDLPEDWDAALETLFETQESPLATRAASGKILNAFADRVTNIMGGSADLGPSNKTMINGEHDFNAQNPDGRNMRFGVREHVMAAIANGMALHRGVIPYVGTFLVFSDYMRPSIRLAALMGLRVIYVFTHDSIGVGEDGPTHQPIEQVSSLRTIPNLHVIRPADAHEAVYAWRAGLGRADGPTALVLTRQKLPLLKKSDETMRGGYIAWEDKQPAQAILIATGSELHIAIYAAEKLKSENISVSVVSMPCCEIFDSQPRDYKQAVLPPNIRKRLAIEAGITSFWKKYVGLDGDVIGIDHFGASAPASILFEKFGITADAIVTRVKSMISG